MEKQKSLLPPEPVKEASNRSATERLIVFVAQGFGSGRIPVAPGTFGTLVGFAWIALLLLAANLWFFVGGIVAGFFIAVWVGGRAEQILQVKDPGSIVIDEIAALPLAFFGAVVALSDGSSIPGFGHFLTASGWIILLVTFVGFRFFDVAKPWIITPAQHLPGGWGLVVDDFLAALAVVPLTYVAARYW